MFSDTDLERMANALMQRANRREALAAECMERRSSSASPDVNWAHVRYAAIYRADAQADRELANKALVARGAPPAFACNVCGDDTCGCAKF